MGLNRRFDADDLDYEQGPSAQREKSNAPVLIGVGIIAFIAGLFLWGSVASSIFSSGGSAVDDVVAATPGEGQDPAAAEDGEEPIDCDAFGAQRALSVEREAAYQAQCVSPTPDLGGTTTPDARLNRADCGEIRGTDYRSQAERVWFLANCLTN